jgi:hypothetical protein
LNNVPKAPSMPAAGTGNTGNAVPRPRPQQRPLEDLSDMEIPTFIRRQMD